MYSRNAFAQIFNTGICIVKTEDRLLAYIAAALSRQERPNIPRAFLF
jgi:hypothetical protein